MIRVLLCGAMGEMGRHVTDLFASQEDVEIVCGFDKCAGEGIGFTVYDDLSSVVEDVDAVVDFSHPSCFDAVLKFALERRAALVMATTNLSSMQQEALRHAGETIPVFQSANFSFGVSVLEDLVSRAAALLCEDFDVEITEAHHHRKVDAPSGTAKMLIEDVKVGSGKAYRITHGRAGSDCKRKEDEIGVHSLRGGTIVGEHSVLFAGEDELIEIRHTALSRRIFAMGALKAVHFLVNKTNGYFTFKDVMKGEAL